MTSLPLLLNKLKLSGVLPSNTIPNPREDIKVVTTQSGITLAGPSVLPPPPSSSSKEVERDPKTTMDQSTPSSDHAVSSLSLPFPTLPPGIVDYFKKIDKSLLSFIEDSISPEIDEGIFGPKGDIILLEKLLNNDSTKDLPLKELKNDEIKTTESSIEEPPDLELKRLTHPSS
ncbi:hypothetical protein Tco_0618373 [Tanacetum coccineum]